MSDRRSFVLRLASLVTLPVIGAANATANEQQGVRVHRGGLERAGAGGQSDSGATTELYDLNRVGRLMTRRGERDNALEIQAIERKIRCTCGCNLDVYTCRTTDFNCTVSPAMHQQVLAMWQSGSSQEEVIEAFVAQYGEAVLMAPPKEGFNLLGYLMPFVALLAGLGVLIAFMRRRTVQPAAESVPGPDPGPGEVEPTEVSSKELERLRQELEHFDA